MFILVPRLVKLWDLLVLGHQGNLELGLTLLPLFLVVVNLLLCLDFLPRH